MFIYYFIIIIIIILLSTPTSTTATDKHSHRQPQLATIHQQNQQSQQHTHRQPHLDPQQDPPQTNKTQPQLQQNPTIGHHIPTNLHRKREGSVPSWATLGERERSASDQRSPAPPRSLLRSPVTTAKLIAREIGSPYDHCESHREAHQAKLWERSAPWATPVRERERIVRSEFRWKRENFFFIFYYY